MIRVAKLLGLGCYLIWNGFVSVILVTLLYQLSKFEINGPSLLEKDDSIVRYLDVPC